MNKLFEISKSGLRSAQQAMSVTANNVANADTPGYTRRRVEQSPVGMQMSQFHAGLGVNITDIDRLRHDMTDTLLHKKKQNMGYMESKNTIYERLETVMVSDSGEDLDKRISSLFDSFSELSSNPQDISVRDGLILEAQKLTDKLGDISNGIDRASDLTKQFAEKNVTAINEIVRDIHDLNASIQHGAAQDKPDHTSLDLRTQKLQELAELVNFEAQETRNGAIQIEIDGKKVLDENQAYRLSTEVIDSQKKFRLRLPSGHVINPTGGELGGEIEMYTENIPELKEGLDDIAATIVQEFNSLHTSGFGIEDNLNGRNFFMPGGTTAEEIQVNQVLIDNPNHIAASTVPGEAGNGELAKQIADLRNQGVIDDTGGNTRTLSDHAINYISKPGTEISNLNSTMEARDSEIQMLTNQQEQMAGVNIDEELSLMVEYQNAYQGAAKVMQTAREMYDTLLSIV